MKRLIALVLFMVMLCACMLPAWSFAEGASGDAPEVADNPIDLTDAMHFIVRHWHSEEDTDTTFQGDDTATSNGRYFVVVEGYIVPQPANDPEGYSYRFYLVYQSDTTDGLHKAGELEEIRNRGYVTTSNYVEEIHHDNGTIQLSPNPLVKDPNAAEIEYIEDFAAYSVSAGHSAVSYDDAGDSLIITYDPYVHLVKAHAFYIGKTMEVAGATDDEVFKDETVSGGEDVDSSDEIDTAMVYVYKKNGQYVKDGNNSYVKRGKDKKTDKARLAALGVNYDDVELAKIYDTSKGLHTDKTATESTDYHDGRTFDLELEAWYSEGLAPVVGMTLDASGSMAFASDLPNQIQLTDEQIDALGIKKLTKGEDPNNNGGWDNYFLTDAQLSEILDPNNTDNSQLSVSGYNYFVQTSADSDYMPLGYWEGVGPYSFAEDRSADVTTGWPNDHGDLTLVPAPGFSIFTKDDSTKSSKNGILLDAKPTKGSFTISFMIRKNNQDPRKDESAIAPFLYIGPMSGNTNEGGFFNVYRDSSTSTNRVKGNQKMLRGAEVINLNKVFGDSNDYRITLVFENVSENEGTVTAYHSGTNEISTGTLSTPITDWNIIINGFQTGYSGGVFYIDDIYVFDKALDEADAKALNQNLDSYTDKLIGKYLFEKGTYPNGDSRRDWLMNSVANPRRDASKLTGAMNFGALGVATTQDGRILGAINRTSSNASNSPTLSHTAAGWYFITHAGNYDNHYLYDGLKTGKRLIGLNGTQKDTPYKDENGNNKTQSGIKVRDAIDRDGNNTNYEYTNTTSDTPIKFYIDSKGYLRCFFADSSNITVYCSYVYELADSEYVRTESLQRALGLFVTELKEQQPDALVSATMFHSNLTAEEIKKGYKERLVLLDWTNKPSESAAILSLTRGSGQDKGTPDGYDPSAGGVKQYNYGLTGSTATYLGLQAFVDTLQPKDTGNDNTVANDRAARYIIIFTDGKDTGDIGQTDSGKAKAQIDALKKADYTVFTVLLDGGTLSDADYKAAEAFLTSLSGGPKDNGNSNYFFSVKKAKEDLGDKANNMNDADILTNIFMQEILTQVSHTLKGYNVMDYIDPRFDLVDGNGVVWHLNADGVVTQETKDGIMPLNDIVLSKDNGWEITLGGNTDEAAQTPTLYYDHAKDMYFLKWENQNIPGSPEGTKTLAVWNATVTVRAKEDFIGGNAVLTNGNDALENYVYSTVFEGSTDRRLSGTDYANPNYAPNESNPPLAKGFPRTSVNVTPSSEDVTLSQTIYMGEELDRDKIAEKIIKAAEEQSESSAARYYWEYIGRFVNYFNNLQAQGDPEGIIDKLHEMNRSGGHIDANDPDSTETGKMKIISNRMYKLIKGTSEDGKTLSVQTLSELLIDSTTEMDKEPDGTTRPNETNERYLYIPYIYLPDDPKAQTNSTGKGEYKWDVLGYLYFHIDETHTDEGKTYPAYPTGKKATDTQTRMSQLTVSFLTRSSDDRAAWNNSQAILESVYKRDTIYKPAPGLEIEEDIVIRGTFTTTIVSGEIALQVVVDDAAAAELKKIKGTATYEAELWWNNEKCVGTFSVAINGSTLAATGNVLNATITYATDDGFLREPYGLPLGVYTLANAKGVNMPLGFDFTEEIAIGDPALYNPALFTRGVGNNIPQQYIASITNGNKAFVLGDSNGTTPGKSYLDYRFGLYRVNLTATTGELTIIKKIVIDGDSKEPYSKTYNFRITSNTEAAAGNSYDLSDGRKIVFSKQAPYTAEFTITGEGSVTIKKLSAGDYTVEETGDASLRGYVWTTTYDTSVPNTVIVTNAYVEQPGDLVISKDMRVVGGALTEEDLQQTFEFQITLGNGSNKAYAFAEYAGDELVSEEGKTIQFTNGVAVLTLQAGHKVRISGISPYTEYTVTETNSRGYTPLPGASQSGTISQDKMQTVKFVNQRSTGKLAVTKKVTGSAGDAKREFTFTVVLSDTSINGTYGDMSFVDGVATIALRHGEKKTATGLPSGIRYTVTEEEGEDYTISSSGETGVISETQTASANFVNAMGDVEVPETGDRNHPALWLAMVLAGIAGLICMRKHRALMK